MATLKQAGGAVLVGFAAWDMYDLYTTNNINAIGVLVNAGMAAVGVWLLKG